MKEWLERGIVSGKRFEGERNKKKQTEQRRMEEGSTSQILK